MKNKIDFLLASASAVVLILFLLGMSKELRQSIRSLHKEKN